ncbi:hypothetical protein [Flavobacterium sp. HNIBRBA15423]|uniref:hypothetical protein n=1 Tax=Flavobacterium sp. HNIBRBA15423 TaxID=3458683 RepID=UPI004043A8C2
MKKTIYLIIIILSISCKNNNSDNNFRNEIDRIKDEELPNKEYAVTTFEFDTLNGKKFFSEIKNISNSGIKSIRISTEYSENDSLIEQIEIGPFTNSEFLNQKIIKDRNGNKNLYFLLENENGAFIYEIKYEEGNLKKSRIESNYLNWNELIVEMNKEEK